MQTLGCKGFAGSSLDNRNDATRADQRVWVWASPVIVCVLSSKHDILSDVDVTRHGD